jgi:2-keto-4-pentenoate hydratase
MIAQTILAHHDQATLWPSATHLDISAAYQTGLAVRALRIHRGEQPRGYKIGFTNRSIWPRYNATAPIWGTVYDSTLSHCAGQASLSLQGICQPRIEPEAVLSLRAAPPPNCTLDQLFDCVDGVAPGFEIVQSHLPDWKFALPDAVADGSLHARLVVGSQVNAHDLARNAQDFCALLAKTNTVLSCTGPTAASSHGEVKDRGTGEVKDRGTGANVLGDPLNALLYFVREIQAHPSAPGLKAGDVITTGTWTDAFPVSPGQTWHAAFDAPLSPITIAFTA